MIVSANGTQFNRELEREIAEMTERVAQAENEIALQILDDCREATPVRTGKLKAAWGIAVGQPDNTAPGGNEGALETRPPGVPIYVQNNNFRASFFENGTAKMGARPMAAPAVERARGTTVRV